MLLRRHLLQASSWRSRPVCLLCAARAQFQPPQARSFGATAPLLKQKKTARSTAAPEPSRDAQAADTLPDPPVAEDESSEPPVRKDRSKAKKPKVSTKEFPVKRSAKKGDSAKSSSKKSSNGKGKDAGAPKTLRAALPGGEGAQAVKGKAKGKYAKAPKSSRAALLGGEGAQAVKRNATKEAVEVKAKKEREEPLQIQVMDPEKLTFEPVEAEKPPVPMLSYGLDRVLFNPGVYRLQDPRSRIYNFDPYLERIMPVNEFDFEALSEYKTSSKDQDLLDLTKRMGTKFTGSTSSMSGVLQHFHFLLSNFRDLDHSMLSRGFPAPSKRFSKITFGPDAIFLRYKDGIYAIDADKSYDRPNIMSWLGHSLEKLLTTDRSEFELYRRSSPEKAPPEDNASRCYHYSKQGNVLMRSQLDAIDPRLPGTGVFDLKTRAVVSIRMNHTEYEAGSGYQLRFAQGEWESFEREFYDMTRATMLKYSLQVRMGRMDGIFVAFHNIERIFGFQYLSLADMDRVLHGQDDTCLGDQEFKLSVALVDELLSRAIAQFPETTLRVHVEARNLKTPFMYVFAEPVTDEQADDIQGAGEAAQKHFARTVVGVGKDDPEVQEAWQSIQDEVDEQVDEDKGGKLTEEKFDEEKVDEVVLEEDVEEDSEKAPVDEEVLEEDEEEGSEKAPVDEEVLEEEEEEGSEKAPVDDVVDQPTPAKDAEATDGPLMGWTLTVRSKVNGGYVNRPVQLSKDDDWQLEYHIQEIPQESRWKLYNALKDRRRDLVGEDEEEVSAGLKTYRALIQRYSNRGREWRDEQDKINEELGVRMYRPLGPGSDATAPTGGSTTELQS